jgi:cell division protein FtsI (penicillin-binding protein 3)
MARPALRLRAVQIAFALAIGTLIVRAAQVQLVRGARYRAAAREQRTEEVELPASRGAIYDRNGVPLALTQEIFHIGFAPLELRDGGRDVPVLARSLGLSGREMARALGKDYVYLHGPFTLLQVAGLREMRGVHVTSEFTRFHPDRAFARAVLGMPAAPGRPASGIERVLDTLLSGKPGRAVVLRDQFGRRYESPSRLDLFPVPGHDAYLTLDSELQDIVERALSDAVARFEAIGGDVVVLDPKTGELLALASRRADGTTPPSVFTSAFEPGSTAKLFAAAALLLHDRVELTDSVWGEEGELVLGGRTITDEHPEGWMTLRDVLRRSSNVGMAKFVRRLDPEQQYMMLRDFGFGTPSGVEYPSESGGLLRPPAQWSGASAPSLAMGYEIAVTVLQLAQAYAAIANDGLMLEPTLVSRIVAPDGREVYRHAPEPVRRVVSAEVARELRAMLRDVVYDGGTGVSAALASYEVAGKTGTARRFGPDGYLPGASTASFASLFPADDPQLVMVVKLDDPAGSYAQLSAAPLTRSVLEQVLAAQTSALDRSRLEGTPSAPGVPPAIDAGVVPYVVSWPLEPRRADSALQTVPAVVGLAVRAAVRRLHESGLQVLVDGWGTITHADPRTGSTVAAGTLVRLTATEDAKPR